MKSSNQSSLGDQFEKNQKSTDSDSNSGSEAVLEVGMRPPALEGAVAVAAKGGELVGEGQGALQPDGRAPAVLRKRVEREESPLYPGGLAPKRMGDVTMGQDGRSKQQQRRGSKEQGGTGRRGQSNGKWSMPGFIVDPGGAVVLVAGRYTVKAAAVQSQVMLQGIAGRETWLGVGLLRGRGRTKATGWVQSGELQRRATGDADWLARLRGGAGKARVWRTTAGYAVRAQQ